MFGITEKSYQILMNTLSKYTEIEEAILFGSRAKGNYKPGSDIDIAIKGKDIDQNLAMNLSAQLNEEEPLPYFFDIIAYSFISNADLRDHINRAGKVIYTRSK